MLSSFSPQRAAAKGAKAHATFLASFAAFLCDSEASPRFTNFRIHAIPRLGRLWLVFKRVAPRMKRA